MIVFKNILSLLEKHGYSTYRIRKERLLAESTLARLRKGKPVNTETLDVICRPCKCQPGDLIEYVEKEQP